MSQSAIHLSLPSGIKIRGTLRTRATLANLLEDMVQYELPNGIKIDVGWYPDWDPNGEYRIVVFRDDFETPLEPAISVKDELAVSRLIHRLILKHAPPFHSGGSMSSQTRFIASNGSLSIDDYGLSTAATALNEEMDLVA